MVWWQAGYVAVAAAALAIAVLLSLQTLEHRRYARSRGRRIHPKARTERVMLLVPCKGNDADLETNLCAMLEQDHADYEVVFVVESVDDGAYEPIRRLIGRYAQRQARLVVAGLATDSGQKVHNLLVATADVPPETVILAFADADICPPRDWLRLLTQQLVNQVAATGYRWFVPKRPTLANLIVSSIDTAVVPIMFPSIHHRVWGGSWAIRRQALEAGRIREAWHGTLSDDLVAGNVLASMKEPLALETACILPSPIDVDMSTMLRWVRRQFIIGRFYSTRLWAIVLVGHCFSQLVFWTSATAALVGLAQGATWTWQPASVVAALYGLHVLRGWLRQSASRTYLMDRQHELAAARRFDIWCAPLAGLALCVALVGSAIGRRITWKDNVYEMSYGGQIRKVPAVDSAAAAAPTVPDSGTWRRAA